MPKKLKIAIVSTFLGKKSGGAEISSFLLAKNLTTTSDVCVITATIATDLPFKASSLELDMIPDIVLMIGTPLTNWYIYRKLLKILKKEDPDVVHIQDFSILDPALRAAKKLSIPTVMTVRDMRFHCNLDIEVEDNKIIRNY